MFLILKKRSRISILNDFRAEKSFGIYIFKRNRIIQCKLIKMFVWKHLHRAHNFDTICESTSHRSEVEKQQLIGNWFVFFFAFVIVYIYLYIFSSLNEKRIEKKTQQKMNGSLLHSSIYLRLPNVPPLICGCERR